VAAATGFTVVGLSESIKLLGKSDKLLRKEAGMVVRKAATQLQTEARARLRSTPGVSRRSYHSTPKGAITRRATATSGRVGINVQRYPVIGPAEFGWNSQFVPYRKRRGSTALFRSLDAKGSGRFMPQNAMKRRTFPVNKGSLFKFPKYGQRVAALSGPGWIVQPVLRKRLGMIQEQLDEDMAEVFKDASRRAGLRGR
jgi:hypothetical protein